VEIVESGDAVVWFHFLQSHCFRLCFGWQNEIWKKQVRSPTEATPGKMKLRGNRNPKRTGEIV